MNWYDRTHLLVGEEKFAKLKNAHVMVVGLGGVGGFAAECIARAGVGTMSILDSDMVSVDNRNRQLVALASTVGQAKTSVLKARLLDINPELTIHELNQYLEPETVGELLENATPAIDYIIDAIDTLTPKTALIMEALKRKIPIISSMGAGAKFDPTQIQVADISKTFKCPLAQRLRTRLRERGVNKGLKVVFSGENFDKSKFIETKSLTHKKTIVGTMSYLPPIFGGFCAAEVIKAILFPSGDPDFHQ